MKRLACICTLIISAPALAQTPQPQQTPSKIPIQMTSIIGTWAQTIEMLQRQNAELQVQLDAVTKERDALKAQAAKK